MLLDIFYFLAGLVLLVTGGNYVTDGAVGIARRWGVPPLMIGLVLVSIGSSLPDLVVCLMSTASGKSTLAVGDVVGSNIFDVILVLGVMAVVRPYSVDRSALTQSFTMLFIASLVLFFFGDDSLVNGGGTNVVSRSEGLALLVLAFLFFRSSISSQKYAELAANTVRMRNKTHLVDADNTDNSKPLKAWLAWTMLVGGLGALVVGGDWLVKGASAIAAKAGMSESLIGLTIVSFGGASPDLAASLAALLKGKSSLALGNIIGACILNVFWVLGTCATVAPVHSGAIGTVDYLTFVGGVALVWSVAAISRSHRIGRVAGIVMLAVYGLYTAYLFVK